LIVLDSTEECAQPATYADRLNKLDIGSGTRVLATGRHQWPELRHARSHDLHSLDALSAVAILRAMAEQEPPTYPLMGFEHQIASAARCHPRLLQYAVRWADTYPPEHVLESLRTLQGADAQEALDDMIRKTVRQLEEQPGGRAALTSLRRLAVCRSGFTFDSALALIGGPKPLALLKQWGLVGVEAGRYDVQPLVAASVGIDQSAGRAHYEFYRMLAKKHDDKQDYQGLDVESANLEAAFEWAMTAGNAESAFMLANTCRRFLENRGRFDQQMSWIERVAAALAKSPDEALRAAVQNSLGLVYQNYPGGDRRLNLRRAIAAFKEALQSRTLIGSSLAYAGTQNNLGNAYCALADVEDRAKNLKRAVAAYEDALRYYTPRNAPSAYAGTQNNLGNAYRALAEVEEPAQNLQRATVAYQVALRYYTPTTAPLAYAGTQNNLGNAFADLAAVEDRTENLQRAVEAYQEALRLYTPTSAPLEYAMAQNNLGIAYRNLADVRDRPENLRLAVEAYQQALTIYTPTSAPLDYAMTQNNLGNAYRNLAAIKGDAAHLHRATAAYQEALRFYTPTAAPLDYAMTQNNLGSAYRNLADLEEPEANLRRAVAAYDEALRYRTPFTSPLDYAMTQRNLGIAQEKLGDLRGAIAAWRKAERSYRQMGVSDKADLMLRWIGDAGG
jgi:tetratricopeptide (TPR) repeat protein